MSIVRQGDMHVRTLTFDEPEHRNALSADLLAQFVAELESATSDGIRALVLSATPAGGVWSAGHDIAELPHGERDPLTWDNPLEEALRAVRDAPFPVIAAVDGSVWGGACDLVLTCDLVVAVRTASFAITPARLGIPYNTAGVSHFISALPLHIAKEMFFTADPISAEQAAQFGVVNRLVGDREEMLTSAAALAERIASRAPLAVRAIKAEMAALTDARMLTSDTFEKLSVLRTQAWTSRDYAEGLAAFHERRPAMFTGE
ncbi:MAG TPA: methylmalonyl-CoA decarboxylase [Candidatus Nanopelagicales bacterium]|nr:methylmalonyl-CoA decarboxylase [Candidatus Nanopelagicales bacterium]